MNGIQSLNSRSRSSESQRAGGSVWEKKENSAPNGKTLKVCIVLLLAPRGLPHRQTQTDRRSGQGDCPIPTLRAHSLEVAKTLQESESHRALCAPATCPASRWGPAVPTGDPDIVGLRGPRADPGPPGGGREQLSGCLPRRFPSPGPPATHGFSLGGGPGAQRRLAGRRGGGAARRCGGPARPPGPRARRRCPRHSATASGRAALPQPWPPPPRAGAAARAPGSSGGRAWRGRAGGAGSLSPPPVGAGRQPASNTKEVPGSGGAPREAWRPLPAGERPGGQEGRTDGRTGARASGHPGGAGQGWGPSRSCLAPGGVPPPAGLRGPRGERKFQGQLWAAAAAAARGAASPAEVCRRAGKRRLLLPSLRIGEGGGSEGSAADTGREGGEAKERKGGGEKGRPGNHLRLPRPPRPAPAASGGPGASAHPAGAGPGAQSRDAHVAAPTPLGSPRAVGQSPRPPPGPGWSAVPAPRRRRRQDCSGQLRSLCSPAPLPTALRSQERPAPPRGERPGPLGVPLVSPTSLLEGSQYFWAARVDLKENVFRCPVARGSVAN
ncbi:collagen alpha-1(I) chain-like [Pongo pygmaeus]|uniref:collagen alpha-1(I) chain-like n=1 Tax=Pongo pygmaeus TaxID=9600 RepID=UPI00300C1798